MDSRTADQLAGNRAVQVGDPAQTFVVLRFAAAGGTRLKGAGIQIQIETVEPVKEDSPLSSRPRKTVHQGRGVGIIGTYFTVIGSFVRTETLRTMAIRRSSNSFEPIFEEGGKNRDIQFQGVSPGAFYLLGEIYPQIAFHTVDAGNDRR